MSSKIDTSFLIYNAFVEYFENLQMTKIKNVDKFSCYYAKITAFLGTMYKYVIVIVPIDNNPLGTTIEMSKLNCISLQTRMLSDNHHIMQQLYNPNKRLQSLNHTIINKGAYYTCPNIPSIKITLLKEENRYVPKANLLEAINTYDTVITFDG